jgi:hypothetical protein
MDREVDPVDRNDVAVALDEPPRSYRQKLVAVCGHRSTAYFRVPART